MCGKDCIIRNMIYVSKEMWLFFKNKKSNRQIKNTLKYFPHFQENADAVKYETGADCVTVFPRE